MNKNNHYVLLFGQKNPGEGFKLTIVATDNGATPLSSKVSLYIKIIESDEKSPTFDSFVRDEIEVLENCTMLETILSFKVKSNGFYFVYLNCHDGESACQEKFRYSIDFETIFISYIYINL